jgi:signal transduction histidine kinase
VRDRIVQVFLNLVLNALDATEEGATIEISTTYSDGRLAVEVRDEGTGISPAAQRRLFAPYFTTKPTGTGLGLFVCRNILAECGGTIELVESSPSGTTFRVTFPAAAPSERAPDRQPAPALTVG